MKFLIKLLIVIAIIMGLVFLVLQCSGGSSCIQRIDEMEPDKQIALYEVHTPTHYYLADKVTETKEAVIMSGWYERIKDKWVYHKTTIELPFSVYGKITYGRR